MYHTQYWICHQMCPRYWPDAVGDVMEFDTLLVEMETEETIEDDIISRQFRITKSTEVRKGLPISVQGIHCDPHVLGKVFLPLSYITNIFMI